jgi:hypothetical protein
MRDWHLRQRGRAVARGERVGILEAGIGAPLEQAGALPNSLSPELAEDGADDRCSMQTRTSNPMVNIAHSQKVNGDPSEPLAFAGHTLDLGHAIGRIELISPSAT